MILQPVLLCGGPGSRLWPASSEIRPKPFVDLVGEASLFRQTLDRVTAIGGAARPLVVAGLGHADLAAAELETAGTGGTVICEPVGRESGPAILAAAFWAAARDPEAILVVVATDHHIPDTEGFARSVHLAARAAANGAIVTFGVRPTAPLDRFGYIRPGAAAIGEGPVLNVARFEEKPDAARAATLIAEGCLWNSGNFVVQASVLLEEAYRLAPDMYQAVAETAADWHSSAPRLTLSDRFANAPKVSIDVAIMERTDRAGVLAVDYAWSDLGAWDALHAASPHDPSGNALHGRVAALQTSDSLIRAEGGARVLALGIKDVAVIANGRDVLVTGLRFAAQTKTVLSLAADAGAESAEDDAEAWDGLRRLSRELDQWLTTQALPTWWCFGADHERGGFRDALLPSGLEPSGVRRTRVQARQIFVYARAAALGWSGPWRAAIEHGLVFLNGRLRRDDGLLVTAVDADGAPVDARARLYEQSFGLLALAAAAEALPAQAETCRGEAERLLSAIDAGLAHLGGGWRSTADGHPELLANPIMHMFEACLAWSDIAPRSRFTSYADRIGALFLERLFDSAKGLIPERFDSDWRMIAGAEGPDLEPGHHFEWAWLLNRWDRLRGAARCDATISALYSAATRGVDPTGLTLDRMTARAGVPAGSPRLWPQTERLKAALVTGGDHRCPSPRDALAAARALRRYLSNDALGLWADAADRLGAPSAAGAPASSLYHIVGALDELRAAVAKP